MRDQAKHISLGVEVINVDQGTVRELKPNLSKIPQFYIIFWVWASSRLVAKNRQRSYRWTEYA